MAEATYLQIEGGEGGDSGACRVVELPGAAVRVGRGAVCEVRLSDPGLAEVQCLLRRRGETWHVQPIGPTGLILLAGHVVDGLRPLPADEPLLVGSYRLLIRHDGGERFRSPIEVFARESRIEPQAEAAPRAALPAIGSDDDRLRRWQARAELRERWHQARQDEKKWEARWRAAGEGLRARGRAPGGDRTSPPPVPTGRTVAPLPPPKALDARPGSGPLPGGHRRESTVVEDSPGSGGTGLLANSGSIAIEDRGLADETPATPLLEVPGQGAVGGASPTVDTGASPTDDPGMPQDRWPEPTQPEPADSGPIADEDRGLEDETPATPKMSRALRLLVARAIAKPETRGGGPRVETEPTTDGLAVPASPSVAQVEAPSEPETESSLEEPTVPAVTAAPGGRRGAEFLDAATILAAQRRRSIPEPARPSPARRKRARHAVPTEPAGPAQWEMPAWVAVPPAMIGALVAIGVGLVLTVGWTVDNLSAGLAARAALRGEDAKPVPLDPTVRVETRWWKTTAAHLALWSAAIERSPEAASRRDEVRDAIGAARAAAPLHAAVRHATAQAVAGFEPPPAPATLGLSRDVVTLTMTGRTLKRAGKAEAALRAYRRALELAADAEPSRLAPPAFDDDPEVRRFRMPHEAIVSGVIRDMIEASGWGFAEWSAALPPRAVVRLAAARTLREKGEGDAEEAMALVLADDVAVSESPALAAEDLAAKAEALALGGRRAEAADRYREAVASAGDDATRRRWLLALAEVLAPLGRSGERAEILESAKATDPTDEVTRRAVEAQQFAGLK